METSKNKFNKPPFIQIPNKIKLDSNLKDIDKLIFGEIYTLSIKSGECFAHNGYFAKVFSKSKSTVSESITNLENAGYVMRCQNEYGNRIITVIGDSIRDDAERNTPKENKNTTPENTNTHREIKKDDTRNLDEQRVKSHRPLLEKSTYNREDKREINKEKKVSHYLFNFYSEAINNYLSDLLVDEECLRLLGISFTLSLVDIDIMIAEDEWKKYAIEEITTSVKRDRRAFLEENSSEEEFVNTLTSFVLKLMDKPGFKPERSRNFALRGLSANRMERLLRQLIEIVVVESYKEIDS